jgi:hypothetical protein
MNNEELLTLYLEKIRLLAQESLAENKQLTVMEALKQALLYIEGEMSGY